MISSFIIGYRSTKTYVGIDLIGLKQSIFFFQKRKNDCGEGVEEKNNMLEL